MYVLMSTVEVRVRVYYRVMGEGGGNGGGRRDDGRNAFLTCLIGPSLVVVVVYC